MPTVPEFLRKRDQWLVWWYRSDSKKLPLRLSTVRTTIDVLEKGEGRVPRDLIGSANERENITHFEDASDLAQYMHDAQQMKTGIGYALTGDDQVIVFDFDDVLDDAGKLVDDRIAAVLRDLATYVEVSPSGKGLHAFCAVSPELKRKMIERIGAWCSFVAKPDSASRHSVFVSAGYVTVTGDTFGKQRAMNTEADDYIAKWFSLRFPAQAAQHAATQSGVDLDDGGVAEQVDDALDRIDADCDRDTWVRVGMVLHKLTQGDDRGLQRWDEWSRRSPHRYPKQNEQSTRAIYRSFDASAAKGVSLGTLLHMAKTLGTDSRAAVKQARERLQRTINSAKDDLAKLARQRGVTQQEIRGGPDGIEVVSLSEIESEATRWLWTHLVPFGHLILISGGVSAGKSTFLLKLAADVSHAKPLAYDAQRVAYQQRIDAALGKGNPLAKPYKRSGRVYYLTSEMHWAQTAAPTLHACGARADNVFFVRRAVSTDKAGNVVTRPFDLASDLDKLIRDIVRRAVIPDLIVLDPITSFMGTQIDRNAESDVRSILELMADFCASIGTAFIGVLHQNKSLDHAGVGKLLGSVAFGAVARVVLFVWPCATSNDTDDEGAKQWEYAEKRFGVVVEKSNIGATDMAHVFRLSHSKTGLGVDVDHVEEVAATDFFRAQRAASDAAKAEQAAPKRDEVLAFITRECVDACVDFKSMNAAHEHIATGASCSVAYARKIVEQNFTWVRTGDGTMSLAAKTVN